ncbi:MAG: hypothetical protein QE271_01395 [Bacteriovoracaceae bacterium]|nr:hypothetical protein [Bacteriovoracaceae bacterium]
MALEVAQKNAPISIHAFVLMANHYHLVATTPNNDIDSFMMNFNKNFSEKLKSLSGAINQKFGGRYKWCIIENQNYYYNVMRYVFRNPVRAGLVKKVENYPYSTAKEKMVILSKFVSVNMNLDHDNKTLLSFFNNENYMDDEVVKMALRRTHFLPSLDKNTLKPKKLLLPPN